MERPIGYKMAALSSQFTVKTTWKRPYRKTSFFENFKTQKISSPRVFDIFERGFHKQVDKGPSFL